MSAARRRSAAPGGRRAVAVVAIVPLGLLGACQSSGPSARPTVAVTAVPSASPSPSDGASPSLDTVTVDPTLLSILPRDVDGVLMLPAPDTATTISLDSSLVPEVEAIAVALAVAPGSSGNDDLVIANVVRLRPNVFDDVFFEGWRTTYDTAACDPAGGVKGTAEATIGGRTVFVGTCVNGGLTYHTRYGEDVIVSLTSTGKRGFGKIVMEHLGS